MASLLLRLRPLPGAAIPLPDTRPDAACAGALETWSAAVSGAETDACLVLDVAGVVRAVSAPASRLLGCSVEELHGRSLLDVLHLVDFDEQDLPGDYADRLGPLVVLRSRGLMRGLVRIRRPDGLLATFDCTSAPVHDGGGGVIGSVSFLLDLTRR